MDVEPAYQAALDYLYSFIDYSLQRAFRNSPEKFDLRRMVALVESLGNPQLSYPVIHVAGTKGKGSVCALCASALQAAGYRVGFYSSPHLEDYAERIQVDGKYIPHQAIIDLVEELKPHVTAIPDITTFEITTALGFLYFARQNVEVAVIEVGLGGRLDATNVVFPEVAVITSLSYDHTYLLGDTLAEIAAEKAGIIKPGVPVVVAPQKEEARQVVAEIAKERSARLIQVGEDYRFSALDRSLDGQSFIVWPSPEFAAAEKSYAGGEGSSHGPARLYIPLLGRHQVENAATAYAALHAAKRSGLEVDENSIRQGFASVRWPGRFELLRRNQPVVVDSAHNRDSAQKLKAAVNDYFPNYAMILVFGASEDKDIRGMLEELCPGVQEMIAVQSGHPRAIEADKLVEYAQEIGAPARAIADTGEALEAALEKAGAQTVVLVTGSLFVVSEARQAWQKWRDRVISG